MIFDYEIFINGNNLNHFGSKSNDKTYLGIHKQISEVEALSIINGILFKNNWKYERSYISYSITKNSLIRYCDKFNIKHDLNAIYIHDMYFEKFMLFKSIDKNYHYMYFAIDYSDLDNLKKVNNYYSLSLRELIFSLSLDFMNKISNVKIHIDNLDLKEKTRIWIINNLDPIRDNVFLYNDIMDKIPENILEYDSLLYHLYDIKTYSLKIDLNIFDKKFF